MPCASFGCVRDYLSIFSAAEKCIEAPIFCTYINCMEIEFDPLKRQRTLDERGLDFADAPQIFEGRTLAMITARFVWNERDGRRRIIFAEKGKRR